MIAFASVLLGLIVGVLPVTVLVEGSVSSVHFELDGRAVGQVDRAPWIFPIDFGVELLPHELVARGFDRKGKEVARVAQFVNLPRPLAEVEVLLERDGRGVAVAAHFSSRIAERPAQVRATFDGKPLAVETSTKIKLPTYDTDTRHVLTIELEFSGAVRSRADVALGLGEGDSASSELTAVVVRARGTRKFPRLAELSGALLRGGQPLSIAAMEDGPALVCLVREPSTDLAIESLGSSRSGRRYDMALEKEDRLRIIWPVPQSVPDAVGAAVYQRSKDFTSADGGILWMLMGIGYRTSSRDVRLADAAAVAGLEASASGYRRAVVLVLGGSASDGSRDAPGTVRRFLATIHVPLFVWSLKDPLTQPLAKDWGQVENVSSQKLLNQAVDRLKANLASQRVIWVKGRYLPQEITLAETAAGLEFAR